MDEGSSCSSDYQASAPKMNKIPKMEAKPDRLSELPDSLLLQIISCLPVEDALQTGSLSTKWKNLWKHVDEITVNSPFEAVESDGSGVVEADEIWVQKTLEATDRILGQFSCPNIRKLTLGSRDEDLPPDVVDKWIQWAYSRNIKVLILEFVANCYCAPEWFFQNSSLERMCIRGPVDITVGGIMSWTSLKSLSLAYMDISDEEISKILLGCPSLENLALNEVCSVTKLIIVSSSVKNVRVINDYATLSELSVINAPWLEYLDITGLFIDDDLRLTNVSSLLKANLNLTYKGDVGIYEADWFLNRSATLLESMVHVEELVLGQNLIQEEVEKYIQGICNNGALYLSRHKVNFKYLKIVKISHSSCSRRHATRCEVERFDFELAAYILRNAHYLRKLVIRMPEYRDQHCHECYTGNNVSGYFSLLSQKIFHCFVESV